MGVSVRELFQPKVIHLEAGFIVPDSLVSLLVAHIETLGIIGVLQGVQDVVERPIFVPLLGLKLPGLLDTQV